MEKLFLSLIIVLFSFSYALGQATGVSFKSADTAIENSFNWAKITALSYVGKNTDPVGPWYEAALPGRFAFCMRDVSHQSLGAEILGLHAQNKNMFSLFAKNISDNKDWCSYWEINKWGKPAPVDYKNDKDFWYNLPSNFDVITSLWKLYLWTGDKQYIQEKAFQNFYKKSLNEYIQRWTLSPDSLLTRNLYPKGSVAFKLDGAIQTETDRGLPSYVESVPNMKVGVDLIAALYRANLSYAFILQLEGKHQQAQTYIQKGKKYQDKIYENWMMPVDSIFYTYYSNDGKFGGNHGEEFLLWFDALKDKKCRQNTLKSLLASNMNVESTSYMPLFLYRNDMWSKAYEKLLFLSNPETKRRLYPEVSYGVIEGIVQGFMGVDADARTRTITTEYRTRKSTKSSLSNVSILGTSIDVTHENLKSSTIQNNGKLSFVWDAVFIGNYHKAKVDGKISVPENKIDENGVNVSFIKVKVEPGEKINISVF